MQISEFLQPENVVLDLSLPSKERLLQDLADRAAKALGLSDAAIFTALSSREQLGSTGLGRGVAIPHATITGIEKPFGLLARLNRPVDFEAIDEAPVDVVFLLLNPAGNSSTALKALSCMARTLRDSDVMKLVRSAPEARTVYERIASEFGN